MALSKNDIRLFCRKIRDQLTQEHIQTASQEIYQKILLLPIFQESLHIGLFMAMPKEVRLENLLKLPKHFYLPILQPDMHLQFHAYQPQVPMIKNKWGIQEPSPTDSPMDIQSIDVIFIPMLAFNQQGYRLGMGKGCFDRTLPKNHHSYLIGVAFDIQQYENLPIEPHDIQMDMIITEKRILEF